LSIKSVDGDEKKVKKEKKQKRRERREKEKKDLVRDTKYSSSRDGGKK